MSLLEQVKEAGVIGAGGAGFPTHAKLNCKAEYILMNGAECEPLLRVDQQLMAMYPDEIIKGFKAAGELVGAKKAIIGIKGKHHDVIEILEEHIKTLGVGDYVSVGILPDIYPAGDGQVRVYQLTGLRGYQLRDLPERIPCTKRKSCHGEIHHFGRRYSAAQNCEGACRYACARRSENERYRGRQQLRRCRRRPYDGSPAD